jgi:hypothetical protein
MDQSQMFQMMARMFEEAAQGQKASGTPWSGQPIYGTGGLFGRCDGPATLVNALVGPVGFEAMMTWVGNNTEYTFVDALSEISETGSEQSTACGDCKTVDLKACQQNYCFGRFCRQSKELQFDKIGLKANVNVPVRTLMGAITDASGNTLVERGAQVTDEFFLETRKVGYMLRYKNSVMLWNGTPVNNSGAYEEYKGFETIVNTGKYDSLTEISCDAIDSFLMDFSSNAPASAGTYAIRRWFERPVMEFMRRASGAGMDWPSATMYIVMHENAWPCVARAYSCAGLDLCVSPTTSRTVNQSADQALARYEGFLNTQRLPIYGREYPVVLDSQIPQTTGQANGIVSDIYFLTTEVGGNTVLYGEYQDFNQTYGQVRQQLVSMFNSDDIYIFDGGRYALVRDNSRGCFDVQLITKPRIVAVMPQLLGRIQNVACSLDERPLPDVSGSGGTYELGGGRDDSPIPTLYGVGCVGEI